MRIIDTMSAMRAMIELLVKLRGERNFTGIHPRKAAIMSLPVTAGLTTRGIAVLLLYREAGWNMERISRYTTCCRIDDRDTSGVVAICANRSSASRIALGELAAHPLE